MAGLEVVSLEEKDGDFVFEIEITSNRPDWLSVLGIAREVAAITGKKLKKSQNSKAITHQRSPIATGVNLQAKEKFEIEIENKKDCPLYTARILRNVKVGPSPAWLRDRLELVGVRSVNNVVDITNYVLFEQGEPLHAFDLDKLTPGPVIIRRAREGESLVSLDGQARKLTPDTLVIADRLRPVAVAGVMGGKETEVTEATVNVLLEAAIFDPALVRRGRQKLGMASDASYRFERGIDPESVESASLRCTQLISEIGSARLTAGKSCGSVVSKTKSIELRTEDIRRHLGIDIPAGRVKGILDGWVFRFLDEEQGRTYRRCSFLEAGC